MEDDLSETGGAIELVEPRKEQAAPLVASSQPDGLVVVEATPSSGTASNPQVAVNIVISFVGAGLLGIPRAFSRAGWLLGSVTLCTVSSLNIYAMMLLPKVRKYLQQHRQEHKSDDDDDDEDESPYDYNTYGGIGRIIMGKRGEFFVNLCLVISQVGFATAYIIFIADSLESRVARWKVCFGCVPGLALLVQARDMGSLSPFSLLANCANLLGLSAVLWQDVETLEQPEVFDDPIHAIKWSGMVYVMAVTLYSMEGVGLILSLETSCRNTSHFPWLLTRVVGGITIFMCLFGSISYAAFGPDTLAPITLNLGQSSRAATLVQGALCVALYLTYPVMMFPVWTIAEKQFLHRTSTSRPSLSQALLRTTIVVLTTVVAFAVPDFGDYLSLVGSSICNILGFLLPCHFNLYVFGKELTSCERIFNYCLVVGAVTFGLMGTWQSFVNLVNPEEVQDGVP